MVRCLFFAQCSDWMKVKELEIPLFSSISIQQLLEKDLRFIQLNNRKSFLKVAINQVMVDFQTEVKNGDEIAFMPPFSGG
ncbi:MAG: MoaD/ThiS family protein [Elusimicrobiota bacterium]